MKRTSCSLARWRPTSSRARRRPVKLRGVFARLSRWIADLWSRLKGDPRVDIPPRMREILDRTLATSDEIEAAKREVGAASPWKTREESGMTPSDWDDYQERLRKNDETAHAILQREVMETMAREDTQTYHDTRARVANAVQDKLAARPEWVALNALQHGEFPENFEKPRSGKLKLDRRELFDRYGEEGVKLLPGPQRDGEENKPNRGPPLYATDGMPLEKTARDLGYQDFESLYQALIHLPDHDALVEAETDAEMQARGYTDPLKDGSIVERARARWSTTGASRPCARRPRRWPSSSRRPSPRPSSRAPPRRPRPGAGRAAARRAVRRAQGGQDRRADHRARPGAGGPRKGVEAPERDRGRARRAHRPHPPLRPGDGIRRDHGHRRRAPARHEGAGRLGGEVPPGDDRRRQARRRPHRPGQGLGPGHPRGQAGGSTGSQAAGGAERSPLRHGHRLAALERESPGVPPLLRRLQEARAPRQGRRPELGGGLPRPEDRPAHLDRVQQPRLPHPRRRQRRGARPAGRDRRGGQASRRRHQTHRLPGDDRRGARVERPAPRVPQGDPPAREHAAVPGAQGEDGRGHRALRGAARGRRAARLEVADHAAAARRHRRRQEPGAFGQPAHQALGESAVRRLRPAPQRGGDHRRHQQPALRPQRRAAAGSALGAPRQRGGLRRPLPGRAAQDRVLLPRDGWLHGWRHLLERLAAPAERRDEPRAGDAGAHRREVGRERQALGQGQALRSGDEPPPAPPSPASRRNTRAGKPSRCSRTGATPATATASCSRRSSARKRSCG